MATPQVMPSITGQEIAPADHEEPVLADEAIEEPDELCCRNCLSEDNVHDLIAPCKCKGSMKFVHRKCLDTWRTVSPKPSAFTTCDYCQAHYRVIVHAENQKCLKAKFASLVARDIVGVLLIVNVLIVGVGWLSDMVLPTAAILQRFTKLAPFMDNMFLRVYCLGGLVFFFVLGLVGIFFFCYKRCCASDPEEEAEVVTQRSYPYSSSSGTCYWIYCGPYYTPHYGYVYGPFASWDCSCCGACCQGCCESGGSASGGGNCDAGKLCEGNGGIYMIVVLLIIAAIIILVGLFFGIFLLTTLAAKIAHRHLHVLERSYRSSIFVVADLSKPEEVAESIEIDSIAELQKYKADSAPRENQSENNGNMKKEEELSLLKGGEAQTDEDSEESNNSPV